VGEPHTTETISGWGRYPLASCAVYRPERRSAIAEILDSREQQNYIARGRGRSYGDTAINEGGGVVETPALNQMIAFDQATGTLECEAGVGLDTIIDTFMRRGWFLPVTPGTRFVTVGGAIANDVHGKNHHSDGAFCDFVDSLTLLIPTGAVLTCSRTENADVFWATVGGIGLTGFILTVRLRLLPVETAYAKVDYHRAGNLDEALALLHEHDEKFRYSVAWIDCLATGSSMGRSVLMLGDHAQTCDLPPSLDDPYDIRKPLSLDVPIDFPSIALNPYTIKAFNELFYTVNKTTIGKLVDYERYFYPLDAVGNWNRVYGSRGFTQYQFIIPPDAVDGLAVIIRRLSEARQASFLAVLKRCGEGNDGLLSFPIPGYMLALDIPMTPGLVPFLREMDRIVLDYGGRLYFAKDATTTPETIRAMYGDGIDRMREIRQRLDPGGVLSSSMARRLGVQ
jgi:decaprenylphospho-beta-D-ribofuranose 2-oxidase